MDNRRHHPITSNKNCYSSDKVEFMMAVDRWKREKCILFPTLSELLRILKSLGYEKIKN